MRKKGQPFLFFLKKCLALCFFPYETYPPLEVSMGGKIERKKEIFGRWVTSVNAPTLGVLPYSFFFKKKKKHTFVSWKHLKKEN
jgi:hypothetical protein